MFNRPLRESAASVENDINYGEELTRLANESDEVAELVRRRGIASQEAGNRGESDAGTLVRQGNRLSRPITTALDPFLSLPADVSTFEQTRLRRFLALSPTLFGISDQRYSPTQAVGIPIALHSAIGRQWICLCTDEALHALRLDNQPSGTLVRRRLQGYQALKAALQNRHTQFEQVMLAMTIIGMFETGFGGDADLHVAAMDMLLRSRGTLKNALLAAPRVDPFFVSGQYIFGKSQFKSLQPLSTTRDQCIADLQDILVQQRPTCDSRPVSSAEDSDASESGPQLQARVTALLVSFVRIPPSSEPPANILTAVQTVTLAMLMEMAWSILHFSHSPDMLLSYFRRLDLIVTDMIRPVDVVSLANIMRVVAVGPAGASARRHCVSIWGPATLLDSDTTVTAFQIRMSKISHYLDVQGRTLLLAKMSCWLTAEEPREDCQLTPDEIMVLYEQSDRIWKADVNPSSRSYKA